MSDITVINAEDVTDRVVAAVLEVIDGWYTSGRIDWEDVLYRVEERGLDDGSGIEFGNSMLTPAIKKIKRKVRQALAS